MASSVSRINVDQFNTTLDWLGKFVSLSSVSNKSSPDYSASKMQDAADFAFKRLQELGFETSYKTVNDSPPYILAKRIHNAALPTILLYTHYDVQPVNRAAWNTDPFTPETINGRLYGRGSADSKGNIAVMFAAIQFFNDLGKELPVNIKILLEGEEEIGSPNINTLLEQYSEDFQSDAFVVMDAVNKDLNTGTISISTRGCVSFQMRIKALKAPVHSGTGCLVPDPGMALCCLISSLANPLLIPGFIDFSKILSESEREQLKRDSITEEEYKQENGVVPEARLRGFDHDSIYERIMGDTPSLSILNFTAGAPNGGNSIPSFAECQIGIRTFIGQNPSDVRIKVIEFLLSQKVMWNLPIEITTENSGTWAWAGNVDGPLSKKYSTAFTQVFGQATIMPCGGSLPLYHKFTELFPATEIIPIGAIDPSSNIHGDNESQDLSLLRNQIDSFIQFMQLVI